MDPLTASRPLLTAPGRFTSSPVDSYIKNCLGWHSNTFLMYLRNTFHTTEQHTTAITLGLSILQHWMPLDHLNNTNSDPAPAQSDYPDAPPYTTYNIIH